LTGRAEPVVRLLRDLESLEGTPLARAARGLRQRVEDCRHLEARAADGRGLVEAVGCVDPSAADPALEARRGGDDFFFLLPWNGGRGTGRGRVGPEGELTVDFELTGLPRDSPWAALLPRSEAVGPTVLSRRDALILGRLGFDRGLDLAAAVEAGGTADRLFKLRNRLFSRAVLTGVWEVAVYPPVEGEPILPMAAALEVSSLRLAAPALAELLDDLGETWPFLRRPFAVGEAEGECLEEIRVLPELDPCYVIRGRTLVVGWNAASVERALSGPGWDEQAERSRLLIELDRFPEAERRLTRNFYGEEAEGGVQVYPWRRAVVSGRREGEVYGVRLELER
jgi:hypothetical protein